MPVLALNIHAGFACRRSGACCTAGWPIPLEADVAGAIRACGVVPAGNLRVERPLPPGAAAILDPRPDGACPAFDRAGGGHCSIQRRFGHDGLPAACRHFPRVALLEPDAVRITLSHFCPTAAAMLWRGDVTSLAVVPDAAGIADRGGHDGFDARQTVPPLLRPGVAMDAPTCRAWERYSVGALDGDGLAAEAALAGVAAAADRVRGWKAGRSSLADHTAHTLAAHATHLPARWGMAAAGARRLFTLAAGSVIPGLRRPVVPDAADAAAADRDWVSPRWTTRARPIRRYLAARSFGAWSAYLGEGLRTQVAELAVALAAVRIEAIRETSLARRPLDDPLLLAAIRSADLLLHHLSDPAALVRDLAGVERGTLPDFLAAIGLEPAP
jgi:hypothetical protein